MTPNIQHIEDIPFSIISQIVNGKGNISVNDPIAELSIPPKTKFQATFFCSWLLPPDNNFSLEIEREEELKLNDCLTLAHDLLGALFSEDEKTITLPADLEKFVLESMTINHSAQTITIFVGRTGEDAQPLGTTLQSS